jgi:hypothetical protein
LRNNNVCNLIQVDLRKWFFKHWRTSSSVLSGISIPFVWTICQPWTRFHPEEFQPGLESWKTVKWIYKTLLSRNLEIRKH